MFNIRYLNSKVEIETENASNGNPYYVIATDIHVCHICLPSAPDSHTFDSFFVSAYKYPYFCFRLSVILKYRCTIAHAPSPFSVSDKNGQGFLWPEPRQALWLERVLLTFSAQTFPGLIEFFRS